MRVHRGLLFWGLALVTAGAVAFLVQQNVLSGSLINGAWRLWPLILVAIGLSILAARTPLAPLGAAAGGILVGLIVGSLFASGPWNLAGCGDTGAGSGSTQARDGTFAAAASVDLQLNCGNLDVSSAPGQRWQLSTTATRQPEVTSTNDRLTVRSAEMEWFNESRQDWQVTLPTDGSLAVSLNVNAGSTRVRLGGAQLSELGVDANAGDAKLDLSGAKIDGLNVSVNAGSASVTLDDRSAVSGSLSANAGSLQLCAPDALGLQIDVSDNVAFGHNLADRGLTQSGTTWTTANYADAAVRATLSVDGNAASFTLNPDGGCE